MAKNPKPLRVNHTKRNIANKAIKKMAQKVKQSHRNIRTSVTETAWEKAHKKELSTYVLKIRAQKAEQRAEKAKALMLKLLKEKRKREAQRIADEINRKKQEPLKTAYIESKLTKKRFKVPTWKADKYCKKWFVRCTKLDYKEQERLERAERKTIALNELDEITQTVPIYRVKMETVEVEYTYDKNHAYNKIRSSNKKGRDTYTKKETVTRPVLDEKGKKVMEKVGERTITIYGIPIKEVKHKKFAHKNPYNGLNRKKRRDITYGRVKLS